jgi:hypothetical protein
MARFLIEVPHEAEQLACARAVEIPSQDRLPFPDACGLGALGRRAQSLDHCGS